MSTKIYAGSSLPQLATEVATILQKRVEPSLHSKFSDGEIRVELTDAARGSKAFVIQSVCSPVNDHLMELILTVDALKRAAVKKITVVLPYFGYARQDRRPGYSRVPISARVVADMMQSVGVDHVVTVDIHNLQIGGFFNVPFDNISTTNIFAADIREHFGEDVVIVSPDVGGTARARAIAKALNNAELAIVDKRRPSANVSEVMNVIGNVQGRTCVMIDDMVDTAGTLCKAAEALITKGGANNVVAYATHGVLSGPAIDNIKHSLLEQLVITDSIPCSGITHTKVRRVSLAPVLAETIHRITRNRSISEILD